LWFKDTKSIDRTTLVSVLEESFRNVIAKKYGSDENFDVIVNPDKGDFPKAEEPSYMIVFLKDQQLYYYLTPYDIIDYYYFGKKHYQIKSPEYTSAPLLMALRNDQLYNEEQLGKGERSLQRTDIEPVYYLQDDIECTGLEPLEPLRSFEVKRGEGELYYRLKVDDQVLSLKASYFIHNNYERSLKTPTYYWKNHTETIEK